MGRARGAALVVALAGSIAGVAFAGNAAASRRQAVGTRERVFVDHSRATPANGDAPGAPERTLRTTIWYPARHADGGRAPIARGSFPVVLFSHGANASPADYATLLRRWAAAGYVVVAPRYPLSSRDAPGGWTDADRAQQPQDASFVLDRVLRERWLREHVDRTRIAAAGHSLGGHTTFALAYGACCRDPRIKAAVSFAGVGYGDSGVVNEPAPPPLLLVHDPLDIAVPYEESRRAFREAAGPRAFVTVHEMVPTLAHEAPYLGGRDPTARITTAATLDFLGFVLDGSARSLDRLCRDASARGRAELLTASVPGCSRPAEQPSSGAP